MLVRGRKVLSGEKNSLALLSHLALSPLPPPPDPFKWYHPRNTYAMQSPQEAVHGGRGMCSVSY